MMLSAETLALNDALDDAVYLKHLLSEIYHDNVRENTNPCCGHTAEIMENIKD